VTDALDIAATRARIDQQCARVRDLLDTRYDGTLATILHTDGQLADIVRVTIGAVVLDLRVMLALADEETVLAAFAAWAQIAEPETAT
jgi:hypothetical protein